MAGSIWADLDAVWKIVGSLGVVVSIVLAIYRVNEDRRFRAIPWWGWVVFVAGSTLLAVANTGLIRALLAFLAGAALVALLVRVGITVSENWHMGATAHFMNEQGNTWALILDRKGAGASAIECIVTDPLGSKTRRSFGEAGQAIHVSYPDGFECACYANSKQPWGRYTVEWNVFRSTKRPGKLRREGRAKLFFTWQPFITVGTAYGRRRFPAALGE